MYRTKTPEVSPCVFAYSLTIPFVLIPYCTNTLLQVSQRLTSVTFEGAVGKQDLKYGFLLGTSPPASGSRELRGFPWGLCSPHRHMEGEAAPQCHQHTAETKDKQLMPSGCTWEFTRALWDGHPFQGAVSPVCISKRQCE